MKYVIRVKALNHKGRIVNAYVTSMPDLELGGISPASVTTRKSEALKYTRELAEEVVRDQYLRGVSSKEMDIVPLVEKCQKQEV